MPRKTFSFQKRELTAAIQAVVAAGVDVCQVEVGDGKIVVIVGRRATASIVHKDSLDHELADFEARNGKS